MREIEFPIKTHDSTKDRVFALAWATNRRGRVPWKSRSVVRSLQDYLAQHGISLERNEIRYAIKWIVENNYGWDKRKEDEQRTTIEFGFHPTINLNVAKPLIAAPPPVTVPSVEKRLDNVVFGGMAAEDIPLPGEEPKPVVVVYKLDTITDLFERWAAKSPDEWADYADNLTARLEVLLDGG